ncbi:MAG: type IV pilus biogenesis/stability protein PilW [Pseudomonadota bacterium]|nr:type IV pilus biogenesis/stability protein PilW [Pseudomonadota bacterium]
MRPMRIAKAAAAGLICALLAACTGKAVRDADATGGLGAVQKESPADLYVKLAVEYLKDGQTETALRKIKKGLSVDDKNAQAHNVIALIYQNLGQSDLAEKHFRRAVSLQPKDPYILNAWGSFLCDERKYSDADEQFNNALSNPLYGTPWVALTNAGICARRSGNTSKAEDYLRRALSANPGFGPAMSAMAETDYQQGRYKSARSYLDRYFKAAPATAQTLLLAVRVERKLGSRKRASRYEKLLRKNFPDSLQVLEL